MKTLQLEYNTVHTEIGPWCIFPKDCIYCLLMHYILHTECTVVQYSTVL